MNESVGKPFNVRPIRMVKEGVLRYEWSIVSIFYLPLSKGDGTLKSETVSALTLELGAGSRIYIPVVCVCVLPLMSI